MKLSLAIISSLVILSCSEDEKTSNNNSQETRKDTMDIRKTLNSNNRMYYWMFETKGEDVKGTPYVRVSLMYEGKLYYINTAMLDFTEIDTADFRKMDIPEGSIVAAKGRWKGSGEDYWIQKFNSCMFVFKRTMKENEEPGKIVKLREIYMDRDYK
jgi:hypothetical protein